MNFLNKETLIDAAALGGGVVAGRAVVKMVGPKLTEKLGLTGNTANIVSNLLPIAGGIATLAVGKGNRIATGVANGMFAASAAYFVDLGLQKALGGNYTSVNGVMMNGVFMNGDGSDESGVLMGSSQDMPNYNSDSFDFTGSDAGELDY